MSTSGIVTTSPELGVAVIAHQINDDRRSKPHGERAVRERQRGHHDDEQRRRHRLRHGRHERAAVSTAAGQTASGTGHSWAAVVATFQDAPLFWRGGLAGCATGSLFTSTTCWSTSSGGASAGVAPGTSDRATFDGGGTGDCALSSSATTQAGSITTTATYTGTITQGAQNVSLTFDLSIGGGTFTGQSGQTIATNQSGSYNGNIVVSGGMFNGNGATMAVQTLFVSSGTFTAGSGNFSTNNGGLTTLSGGTATFSSGTVIVARGHVHRVRRQHERDLR